MTLQMELEFTLNLKFIQYIHLWRWRISWGGYDQHEGGEEDAVDEVVQH